VYGWEKERLGTAVSKELCMIHERTVDVFQSIGLLSSIFHAAEPVFKNFEF
jgi:hypothetical protein